MLVIMILMSSAFILYTVLGLSPSITEGTADINLLFMRFDIERKELLPYVAYIVLAYTIWKFEVTLDDYAPKRRGLEIKQCHSTTCPIKGDGNSKPQGKHETRSLVLRIGALFTPMVRVFSSSLSFYALNLSLVLFAKEALIG